MRTREQIPDGPPNLQLNKDGSVYIPALLLNILLAENNNLACADVVEIALNNATVKNAVDNKPQE